MKNTILIFGLMTALILLGCTQLRDQQVWNINNDSTSDIYIEFTHTVDLETRLDTLSPGEKVTIYYIEGFAMTEGENLEDPTQYVNMSISNDTDTLIKDENLLSNWLVTSEKIRPNNDAIRYQYIFSVSDTDF
jgi:hypothetical protein